MKPTSLSKAKPPSMIFTYNNKQKDTTKPTTISTFLNSSSNVKKSNTFRHQGNSSSTNFKTTKNSPERKDDRNYSGGKISVPSFIGSNVKPTNPPSNKSEEVQIDLFQNKIMNKKEKINMNYNNNNPLFQYKNIVNTSIDQKNLSKSPDIRKDPKLNNPKESHTKRSASINEDIREDSKLLSPRFELLLDKYNNAHPKKSEPKTKSIEQFLLKGDIHKKIFSAKASPKYKAKEKLPESFKVNTSTVQSSSRKGSKDKIFNNSLKSPNLIEILSKKNPNHVNSNSLSNLKGAKLNELNQKLFANKINLNLESNIITEFSKKSTPKILNNQPELLGKGVVIHTNPKNSYRFEENLISSPNSLLKKDKMADKNRIDLPSSKRELEDSIPKKGVISPSVNKHLKFSSKEEILLQESTRKDSKKTAHPSNKDCTRFSPGMVIQPAEKKIMSSNNSPKNMSMMFKKNIEKSKPNQKKELVNKSNILPTTGLDLAKFEEQKSNKSLSLKLNLNSINVKDKLDKLNNSFDNILNTSNCSIISTIRECNYYKKESDKLSLFIQKYFKKMNEYPPTNLKFYKFGRVLGKGAFGKVNLCLHTLSGKLVAIKSFNKNNLKSENSKKKIYYEVNLMKNINHNSVVKIYEMFETQKYIMIVMENICGGDLLSFVRKRTKLNELTAKFIFRQIIEALQHIHSQNIIHRDIKLDNILIDLSNNIKICDFGVGKKMKKNEVLYDQCGTPAYIAPEILRNNGYEGFTVDIWSAGVVLYAMLSGTVPFKANNMTDLHKLIMRGNYSPIKDISEDATNLITGLLDIDAKKRLKIDQILSHPWLRNFDNNGKFKTKMNLFTNAEKILLSKSNVDYKNGQKEDLNENFTLKNLDTQKDTENQNVATKSLILAPFNSSRREDDYLSSEVVIANDAMRFRGKAKEANRNYELNNNGEIDNGILINPPQANNSHSDNNTPIGSFRKEKFSNPVSPPGEIESRKISNFPSPSDTQRNQKKSSINSGSTTNANTLVMDEYIVRQVEDLGYKKDYLMKSLFSNELNYATTTYYLLLNIKLD